MYLLEIFFLEYNNFKFEKKKLFNDKRICLCDDFEVDEV